MNLQSLSTAEVRRLLDTEHHRLAYAELEKRREEQRALNGNPFAAPRGDGTFNLQEGLFGVVPL